MNALLLQRTISDPRDTLQRGLLKDMFEAALSAVEPCRTVKSALNREKDMLRVGRFSYDLSSFNRVLVIGAGKASAGMAVALEDMLGEDIERGIILVKKGNTADLRLIEQVEADHPVPDNAGMSGTRSILALLRDTDARTLVVCLLSGGGSSLLVDPLPGISLEDKQKCVDLFLRAGASAYELNTVCKHLSGVKGGRLARAAFPATVLTLTLSDIIGDRIDVIASGPTAPGNSTFSEAAALIEKFGLRYKLPEEAVALIDRGCRGLEPGPALSTEACFRRTRNIIVGGTAQALCAAADKARQAGYVPDISLNERCDSADRTAAILAKKALRIRDAVKTGGRRCLIWGGQIPEMHQRRSGSESRSLALAFAREISGIRGITLLSAETSPIDGCRRASGAMVNGDTLWFARQQGIRWQAYLDRSDTRSFFRRMDSMKRPSVITGPAGANRLDLQMVLIEG